MLNSIATSNLKMKKRDRVESSDSWRGAEAEISRLGINGSPPGEFVSEEQETTPPATAVNG
jgi:hypothetical protein